MKTKPQNFWSMVFVFLIFMASSSCTKVHGPGSFTDFSRLIQLIEMEDKEGPLFVFQDYEESFDEKSHRASLAYFNDHPELIKRVQADLESKSLRWQMDSLEHRMVFVPEKREEYAALFQDYCNEAIDYTLDTLGMKNPYQEIRTLQKANPLLARKGGVTVFIVHNLAREYKATYTFSKNRKKVVINLKGQVFLGVVGSYTSEIHKTEEGGFEFVREKYTIWQNSAKNPYTALTVPVEETLHILLREYTEKAINRDIEKKSVKNLKEVERIARSWLSVEEAIVGGLVHSMLPDFLARYWDGLSESLIEEDLEVKSEFSQYKFLRRGLRIVETLGPKKALEIYCEDPVTFRKMLFSKSNRNGFQQT